MTLAPYAGCDGKGSSIGGRLTAGCPLAQALKADGGDHNVAAGIAPVCPPAEATVRAQRQNAGAERRYMAGHRRRFPMVRRGAAKAVERIPDWRRRLLSAGPGVRGVAKFGRRRQSRAD